ncbi:8052_t:CDS:2 [Racocetra fulgida]|uniref:8052_t:CDS:1 n=1 Tax=Racocetra fulgida TaxID=60492 RepID=A0A9N8ZLS2_9GLOM|nr:8052_t:CDS:2 [Racocetra fulgida]
MLHENLLSMEKDTTSLNDVDRENVCIQEESSSKVDWNRLRLADLRAMCRRCNLPSDDSDEEYNNGQKEKSKLVETDNENNRGNQKNELYDMLIEARKQVKPKEYKPFQSFGSSYSKEDIW